MIVLPFTAGLPSEKAEGVQSFAETLAFITAEVYGTPETYALFTKVYKEDETGLLERLNVLIDWANQFEIKNLGRVWDGEWMDELDQFIQQTLMADVEFEEQAQAEYEEAKKNIVAAGNYRIAADGKTKLYDYPIKKKK